MAETSVYEVIRQTHEEIERYTQAAADLIVAQGNGDPSAISLRQQHQTSAVLDRVVSRYAALHSLYGDVSGDVKSESERLAERGAEPASDGSQRDGEEEFYTRLNRIRDYHKKYPRAGPEAILAIDISEIGLDSGGGEQMNVDSGFDRLFSGEEMAGRFLDLYLYHDEFLNLKSAPRLTYLQYLDSFDRLRGESSRVPAEAKRTKAYKAYLENLLGYLLQFLRKTRPLADVDGLELMALASFEEDWNAGSVQDWEDKGEALLNHGDRAATLAQQQNSSSSSAQGIWCEACKRHFAKQTVFDAHLKGAKHLKAVERMQGGGQPSAGPNGTQGPTEAQEIERAKRQSRAKAIARDEAVIIALGAELREVRAETRANVERKAALTERERQAEAEAAAQDPTDGQDERGAGGANEDDDEEGERIYNPLKLPLGWDGKPIPFWLYKLHGLGVEFKCEICSDFVYQGRKNFERHFSESRHTFGMRALGLPNTKHFYEITRIQDALTLAEKLKRQGKITAEEQGDAEEVEDEHGNIYTKKTYDLLKRQGLI